MENKLKVNLKLNLLVFLGVINAVVLLYKFISYEYFTKYSFKFILQEIINRIILLVIKNDEKPSYLYLALYIVK